MEQENSHCRQERSYFQEKVCLLTLFLYEFESMLRVKNCAFVIKSCAFVDISEDRGYPLASMIDIWGRVLHHLGVCFTW